MEDLHVSTEITAAICTVMAGVGGALGTAIKVVWSRQIKQHDETNRKLDECNEKHEDCEKKNLEMKDEIRDVDGRLQKLEGYIDGRKATKPDTGQQEDVN